MWAERYLASCRADSEGKERLWVRLLLSLSFRWALGRVDEWVGR